MFWKSIVMDSSNLNRALVCVLFPGIVKNEDKAVQCLGGARGISQVGLLLVIAFVLWL